MSAEGNIKMKKSRSSGEVRRQQDFMTDDESEEKQNSSDVKLQSNWEHLDHVWWEVAAHIVFSWRCFNSHSAFCSVKSASVMETCDSSQSAQRYLGNCCVRAFYGRSAWFFMPCVHWNHLCCCSKVWTHTESHDGPSLHKRPDIWGTGCYHADLRVIFLGIWGFLQLGRSLRRQTYTCWVFYQLTQIY